MTEIKASENITV